MSHLAVFSSLPADVQLGGLRGKNVVIQVFMALRGVIMEAGVD